MKAQLTNKDWELLSAYRDGELSKAECEKLQRRLQFEPALRDALVDLGITHELLGCLPRKRAPYHFTVTRAMLPQRSRWALPLSLGFSLASVSSLVLIVLTFAIQLLPAASMSMEAMPVTEMAQDNAVNEESGETAPLIVWGTPAVAPEPSGGYGGGGEQPYGNIGAAETYLGPTQVAEAPPQAVTLPTAVEEARDEQTMEDVEAAPLVAEEAAPAMEKEESTTESELMQAAPVEDTMEEGQAEQAFGIPEEIEQDAGEDSPILGVRPSGENEVSITSTSDMDTSRSFAESGRWHNPIFWIRLGLTIIAVTSAVAAIYFIRKMRS